MLPDLTHRPAGLVAITPDALAPDAAAALVGQAILGGARMIQYRDKCASPAAREAVARALLAVCRARGCPLVINDDVDLAARIGAAGVHLGRDDAGIARARRTLGPRALIGASCYDEIDRAIAAAREGASYVAFGAFFPSATKPAAVRARIGLLREARARIAIPVAAIGGITVENAPELLREGADLLAVSGDLFRAADIRARAAAYRRLFETLTEPCHES